ncbi:MAG: PAS domain S-box protein [Anaerolineae bacterium]|nr:PAS domain S-box protein [Anaerolineae bacterium]
MTHSDLESLVRRYAKDDASSAALLRLFDQQNARSQDVLDRQEARYRAIVDQQTELVCRYQPDTTLTFVNEAYCRFYDLPEEALIGQSFLRLIPEGNRDTIRQRVQDYVADPTISMGENTLVRHDEAVRWMQWIRRPIFNERGELVEIQAVGRDITELRQAEEAVNRSEERYRDLIEASPDGIMITSRSTIRYANRTLARMLGGQGPEDLQGKSIFNILHPHDQELARERIAVMGHDHEGVIRRHERYVRLDGIPIDVEISIAPFDLDGEPASITVVSDITRRLHSEETLHDFQDRLRALQRLSTRLSKAETFDSFCLQAVEEGRAELRFDRLGLWFLDENRTHIIGSYGTDSTGNTLDERAHKHPTDGEFPGSYFDETHYLHYTPGIDLLDGEGNVLGKGWNALTALWNGSEVIGYLSADNLLNRQPASSYELEVLVLYGSTLGHLATRIRAVESLKASEEQERVFQERLRTLQEINIELTRAASVHELCSLAVDLGHSRLGFDRLSIWFIDEDQEHTMRGSFGIDEQGVLRDESQQRFNIFKETDDLTRQILAGTKLAGISYDVPLYDHQQQIVGTGWVAAAGLLDGSRIIGCMYADSLTAQKTPNRYALELLRLYGATIGHLAIRKWAEEALRQSEQRYRAIFEGAGVGICVADERGYPLSFNPAFLRMLGYSSDELRKKTFLEFTYPADQPENVVLFQGLVTGKRSHYRYEKRYIRKDGSLIWVRVNASSFPGSESDQNHIIAMIEDITDQKVAESKLEESEIRNRALFEALPDLIFLHDSEGVFVDYHAPADAILLVKPETFLNRHYAAVLPPDVTKIMRPHFEAVVTTGEMQVFDYELIAGDETRTYESRMFRYGTERVVSIVRDVTDSKRAEEQLRESEERFRQIADNVDEIFLIRDLPNNRTLYVNAAYEKLWQRPREDLYRDPWSYMEWIVSEDLPIVHAVNTRTSYPDKLDVEYRIIRPDGEMRWIWSRYFPVRDDQNQAYRLIGVVKDITERKQMEQNNLELNLQYERIRIIADFIRDASHQFRTPLSIINSKVYLATRVTDPEARELQLKGIQEQSDNILKLVESLVAMSRLDSDTALSLVTINLNEMLRAVHARHQPSITAAGIDLRLDLETDVLPIKGDVDELYAAFVHLLNNALHFTPRGGSITLRSYPTGNTQNAIEFEDTGRGIEANDLPRIFDRFFRGESTLSTPGFGLGLSMTKKIVERHGGHIEVRSQPGKGSTFTILLPVLSLEPISTNER